VLRQYLVHLTSDLESDARVEAGTVGEQLQRDESTGLLFFREGREFQLGELEADGSLHESGAEVVSMKPARFF